MLKKDELLAILRNYSTKTLVRIIKMARKVILKREVAIELLLTRTGPEIDQILIDAAKENSRQLQLTIIKNLCSRHGETVDLFLMEFIIENQKQPDYEIFKEIFQTLASRPGQAITEFLMDKVWNEQPFVFAPAIRALANRPGIEIDQVLIKCSMNKRWNRHQEAFEALKNRPGTLIDETLIAASKNEGEFGNNDNGFLSNSTEYLEHIRWAAAKAMRNRVGEKIDEALIKLANDRCRYTRLEAVKSMAGRNSPQIKKALKKASRARGVNNKEIAETAKRILSDGAEVDSLE